MPEDVEIYVGTYEEFVLGYTLQSTKSGFELKQSFANHAHTASVRCVAANTAFLASGSPDETVRLFNMKKRTECGTLIQQDGTITCLEFYGPSHLLSGSEDGTVCVWRTKNWQCLKTLRGHKGGITSLSVHPSGKMLLTVSKDKSLKTWNLIKGRAAYTINLKAVSELVRWSPNGENFVIGINNRLDVYSVSVAGVVHSIDFQKRISAVVFLQNNVMAVGGDKADVEVHDLESKVMHRLPAAHQNRVKDMACWQSPALTLLMTLSSDSCLKVWQVHLQQPLSLLAEINTTCRPTSLTVLKPTSIATQDANEDSVANEDERKSKRMKN